MLFCEGFLWTSSRWSFFFAVMGRVFRRKISFSVAITCRILELSTVGTHQKLPTATTKDTHLLLFMHIFTMGIFALHTLRDSFFFLDNPIFFTSLAPWRDRRWVLRISYGTTRNKRPVADSKKTVANEVP